MIRNKKLVDKRYRIEDNYVNWSNWRQFNAIETNHKCRKNVFDCFIEKTELIKPVIEKRFSKIRYIYEYEGGMNPLHGYLESEGISYNMLKEFVEGLANATSKLFNERLVTLSNKIFDRNPEYYDDFYYFRNRVFKDISDEFANVNPISTVIKTLRDLRMNVKKYLMIQRIEKINIQPLSAFLYTFHQI